MRHFFTFLILICHSYSFAFAQRVPADIATIFKYRFPEASKVRWSQEQGNWLATFKLPEKVTGIACIAPDGQLVRTEWSISNEEIPDLIMQTLSREYPYGSIAMAYKIAVTGDKWHFYRIKIINGGMEQIVIIDGSGRISEK